MERGRRWFAAAAGLLLIALFPFPGSSSIAGPVLPAGSPCPQAVFESSLGIRAAGPGPIIMAPCPGDEWTKTFGHSAAWDWVGTVEATADGGLVVGGFESSTDPWIVRLSGSGVPVWQRTYGHPSESDTLNDLAVTSDGGIVFVGRRGSAGAWVVRLDPTGSVVWQRTYAGVGMEASAVDVTTDGGYIVGGWSDTNGRDFWAFRLDALGNLLWEATFGSPSEDTLVSVAQTADGGYILAGYAWTDSGGLFGSGKRDAWLIKLDAGGGVVWQRLLGTSGYDGALSVIQTPDGGYAAAGNTGSYGSLKRLVVKLDANGGIVWQRTYGGSGDTFTSIRALPGGGYIVVGRIEMGRKSGSGNPNLSLVKLDGNGAVVWERAFGGAAEDYGTSVALAPGGGYFIGGATHSFGTGRDVWVLRTDANGRLYGCISSVNSASPSTSTATAKLKAVSPSFGLGAPGSVVTDAEAIATDVNLELGTQCTA